MTVEENFQFVESILYELPDGSSEESKSSIDNIESEFIAYLQSENRIINQ